ncbi:MAG: hypothetical protein U0871_08000 [Gemmataceae bacterium]
MPRDWFPWPAFVAAVLAVVAYDIAPQIGPNPHGFLFGDSGLYAAAADSLLRDGDLDLLNQCFPGKATLADALPELEAKERAGEFGLTADGRLTIKQSPVLAAAAVPFYAAFGATGFLLFNVLVLVLLLTGTAALGGGTPAARLVVLAGLVLTPLWRFGFNYSPDLFLCALLVGSLLAARGRRPVLAGVLAGLAVSTKVYVVVLAAPVVLVAWTAADCKPTAVGKLVLGGLIGLAPGLLFNTWLFGAPWVTGYERQLAVAGGVVGLADHSSRFTVPLGAGLRALLLADDPAHPGFLRTCPIVLVFPVAAAWLLLRPTPGGRAWVTACVLLAAANLGLFAVYDGAMDGWRMANRYLFPALIAGLAVTAAAVGQVGQAVGSLRPDRAVPDVQEEPAAV